MSSWLIKKDQALVVRVRLKIMSSEAMNRTAEATFWIALSCIESFFTIPSLSKIDEVDINSAVKALSVSLEESDTRQDINDPVKTS